MTSWIIAHNPKAYMTIEAFKELKEIDQHSNNKIIVGDTVFIYQSSPVSKIILQTLVVQDNLDKSYNNDDKYVLTKGNYRDLATKKSLKYIRLKAIKFFDDNICELLSFDKLKKNGCKGKLQGSIILDNKLQLHNYIYSIIS